MFELLNHISSTKPTFEFFSNFVDLSPNPEKNVEKTLFN